jgi:hypothetical protein
MYMTVCNSADEPAGGSCARTIGIPGPKLNIIIIITICITSPTSFHERDLTSIALSLLPHIVVRTRIHTHTHTYIHSKHSGTSLGTSDSLPQHTTLRVFFFISARNALHFLSFSPRTPTFSPSLSSRYMRSHTHACIPHVLSYTRSFLVLLNVYVIWRKFSAAVSAYKYA